MSKPREGLKRVQVDVSEECYEMLKRLKKDTRTAIGKIIEDALQNEYCFKKVK